MRKHLKEKTMGFSRLSYDMLKLQFGSSVGSDREVDGGPSTKRVAARSEFRVRSLQRDQRCDSVRKLRLEKALNELSDEIRNEVSGLKSRLAKETSDVAFLMDAIENDDVSGAEARRANELESSVVYARERIKLLSSQIDFYDDFLKFAEKYPL